MNYFDATILSILEGITEFLPISSTGHLILANRLLGLENTEFLKSFEISIQLGAVASVVWLYKDKLFKDFEYLKKVLVAFVPTGVLGFAFYKVVKENLLENTGVTLITLFVGGLLLILAEHIFKERVGKGEINNLSYPRAIAIGLFQSISMIPGVSRSAATIIGGLCAGLKREAAVEFSFLLAIPTMLAATGYDFLKSYQDFQSSDFGVLGYGFIVSFIVALLVVKWFLGYVQKYSLSVFGFYRIALAILFFFLVL